MKGPPVLELLLSLRGLFFVEGIVAMMLYAWVVGTKIPHHGLSYAVTALGFFGCLGYITAIQVKAYNRDSPFDAFSYAGLIAVTVLLVGFLLYVIRQTDHPDGK